VTLRRRRALWPWLLLAPGLAWLLVFYAIPAFNQFYVSLQEGSLEQGYTFNWHWGVYGDVFSTYHEQFLRSLLYAGIATLLALVISFPLAYFIAFKSGRFRNLLLRSLRNFVHDEVKKIRSDRRGGKCQFISWDECAPSRVAFSAPELEVLPAEQLFDLRWAITVAEEALRRLADECARRGRRRLFDALSQYLTADREVSYATVAGQLGLAEAALKKQLHAMRLRYRSLLRDEVARTVQNPSEIDDEIRNLCAALAYDR